MFIRCLDLKHGVIEKMENRQGLAEAYKLDSGTYVAGDSLYLAGSKSARDWWDDLKIPFGMTNRTQRYEDANRVLKANPQVQRIVGHSLGGAVALELQRTHPEMKTVTYGAPVISARRSSSPQSGGAPSWLGRSSANHWLPSRRHLP